MVSPMLPKEFLKFGVVVVVIEPFIVPNLPKRLEGAIQIHSASPQLHTNVIHYKFFLIWAGTKKNRY
jgi:hypothetical protein